VIAVDPAAGRIVRGYEDIPPEARRLIGQTGEFSTDAKEGPVLAQSWFVLDRIRATIESAGGSMSDVFKLVQYFRNLDHFPQYSRVRKLFFPGEPPASTVVEVSAMLPTADILVEVEATAYLPLSRS
jgi:enamine deaminase RidA (YjgF/YER057c/UK114 family)